jgi:hypothetical protein
MLINLRGCNGSGKTTIVRNLLAVGHPIPCFGILGVARPEAYRLLLPQSLAGCPPRKLSKTPLYVLGPYITQTGGCDNLTPAMILELALKYKERGHVLFEGLIISDYYGKLMQTLEPFGKEVIVAYLNTPFEICFARTLARSGKTALKQAKEAQSAWVKEIVGPGANGTRASFHYANCAMTKKNITATGIFRVEEVDSDTGHEKVLGWLAE